MLHLIKLEWLKLKGYLMFKLVILSYLFLLPASAMILRIPDGPPEELPIPGFLVFPHVWETVGYAGNWICFLLFGFLAILMVSNEFNFKTMRQNVMTGLSRRDYLNSKILMFLVISLLAAAYYFLVGMVIGYTNTDYIKNISYVFEKTSYVPRFFLMCFAYMVFAFMIVLLVRRAGIALLVYVIYTLMLEIILRYYVHRKLFGIDEFYWKYPLNSFEDLVYPNYFGNVKVSDDIQLVIQTPTESVIQSLIYIGLFLAISYWVTMRRDL